jgi:hypothetical protein
VLVAAEQRTVEEDSLAEVGIAVVVVVREN